MYFFEADSSFIQLLFQNKNFRSSYFLRTVTFSEELVLRNQLHSTYTWKSFPWTIIYSFKYSMSWSDFYITQFFIVENSK